MLTGSVIKTVVYLAPRVCSGLQFGKLVFPEKKKKKRLKERFWKSGMVYEIHRQRLIFPPPDTQIYEKCPTLVTHDLTNGRGMGTAEME